MLSLADCWFFFSEQAANASVSPHFISQELVSLSWLKYPCFAFTNSCFYLQWQKFKLLHLLFLFAISNNSASRTKCLFAVCSIPPTTRCLMMRLLNTLVFNNDYLSGHRFMHDQHKIWQKNKMGCECMNKY